MDQPGKVATNPSRDHLNKENEYFPVPALSICRLNLVLTHGGIPPDSRGGVHLFI